MSIIAEYIWIDGSEPTQKLRSKTKIIQDTESVTLDIFPGWVFDGSSTNQADGDSSDCLLKGLQRKSATGQEPLGAEGKFYHKPST